MSRFALSIALAIPLLTGISQAADVDQLLQLEQFRRAVIADVSPARMETDEPAAAETAAPADLEPGVIYAYG